MPVRPKNDLSAEAQLARDLILSVAEVVIAYARLALGTMR
jgi:hypothetical protein